MFLMHAAHHASLQNDRVLHIVPGFYYVLSYFQVKYIPHSDCTVNGLCVYSPEHGTGANRYLLCPWYYAYYWYCAHGRYGSLAAMYCVQDIMPIISTVPTDGTGPV
jgi:hypothetical protein